jgi:hypothetical protein
MSSINSFPFENIALEIKDSYKIIGMHTDGSGMISRTIGRTVMFSQTGFPTINRHPRPDPVPMFVRFPRHRLRSVPSVAICATRLDLGHEFHPHHRPRFA